MCKRHQIGFTFSCINILAFFFLCYVLYPAFNLYSNASRLVFGVLLWRCYSATLRSCHSLYRLLRLFICFSVDENISKTVLYLQIYFWETTKKTAFLSGQDLSVFLNTNTSHILVNSALSLSLLVGRHQPPTVHLSNFTPDSDAGGRYLRPSFKVC